MAFISPTDVLKRLSLKEGDVVADFGTGSGAYAIPAARACGGTGKVYAIDIQKEVLSRVRDLAREGSLTTIETIWGDCEEKGGSSLSDGVCDAVIISNILFQISNKEGFIEEAHRVLRLGGKVLFIEWSDSFGNLGPTPDAVVLEDDAEHLFARKGFTKEMSFPAGDHHYGMIMVKK